MKSGGFVYETLAAIKDCALSTAQTGNHRGEMKATLDEKEINFKSAFLESGVPALSI